MCEQMKVGEVVELTGISKQTLYSLMDTGQADLGAVIRGPERNTYVFFRSKVERFVKGGEGEQVKRLVESVEKMNQLLTMVLRQVGGDAALRGLPS